MRSIKSLAVTAAIALMLAPAAIQASVIFSTGNVQYTNVNFDAETHGFTVVGNVGQVSDNVTILFTGGGAAPGYSPIELHAQHGVAFVEAYNPNDLLYRLTLTADSTHLIRAMDWKLAASGKTDGGVAFEAFSLANTSLGSASFPFSWNGENPFNFTTDGGTLVKQLVITSTVPIANIKQVSVDMVAVPEPATLAAAGFGILFAFVRRFRKSR